MSRWSKTRPGIAVPLEALIKEKENANRPSVAHTAGTVGKWGVTSFTSMRSTTYGLTTGLTQYSPRQESANCSPQSGDFAITSPEPPKPRKFFKSRNTDPTSLLKAYPPIQSPQQHLSPNQHHFSSPQSQHNLYHTQSAQSSDSESITTKKKPQKTHKKEDDGEKLEKPAKKKKDKIIKISNIKINEQTKPPPSENLNKRTSSRTRNKVVNYNEEDDDSSSSKYFKIKEIPEISDDIKLPSPLAVSNTSGIVNEKVSNMDCSSQKESPTLEMNNVKETPSPVTVNVKTQPTSEHPPIVLRISKGTSRLISTDSEDATFSPTQSNQQTIGALSSTAELLAVLSDTPETETVPGILPIETEIKSDSIKIKIKTNVLESNAKLDKHKKHHHHHKKKDHLLKLNIKPLREEPVKDPDISSPSCIIDEPLTSVILSPASPIPTSPSKIVVTPVLIDAKPIRQTRVTRSTRRSQLVPEEVASQSIVPVDSSVLLNLSPPVEPSLLPNEDGKTTSPLPGTDNYDLYRTLASPSDKDFDSQSSVLGSISSKETAFVTGVPEDSRVVHSRGSSDLTSDIDTSQSSVIAAPPSEINLPLDTVFESESEEKDLPLQTIEENHTETNINLPSETIPVSLPPEVIEKEHETDPEPEPDLPKRVTRTRAMKSPIVEKTVPKLQINTIVKPKPGRNTRTNNNNVNNMSNNNNGNIQEPIVKRAARSYTRKRKNIEMVEEAKQEALNVTSEINVSPHPADVSNKFEQSTLLPNTNTSNNNWPVLQTKFGEFDTNDVHKEFKIKNKLKRSWYEREADVHSDSSSQDKDGLKSIENLHEQNIGMEENDKPSVKLLISKKKGSIFKSRALVTDQDSNKKRHIYKHKWDDDTKDKTITNDHPKLSVADPFFDEFDGETSAIPRMTRAKRNLQEEKIEPDNLTKKTKSFVTVRNVKKAHQIQEIGEFQEMDDDVEYLLDSLQPQNPISTRCLSAIQLAQKCMTPAFRMHVRAHGTVTQFFNALHDATKDQSLGLCTATVMFVLSQDNLNMDLDRNSLELMLNLLESDVSHKNVLDDCGPNSKQQMQKHLNKVRELCEEIKNQGKAAHLNLENITVGTLAMETLLSLTSKRAGEWFKEELRQLGGLEHIIKTICECCRQISDYVVDWTDILLEKLRKIERCLRVLENVTQYNEENQNYIISYNNGIAIDTLVKLYKLCDTEISLYPTNQNTPKDNPGVVIREALVPTLKVLINLTHTFNDKAIGSEEFGKKSGIVDTSLHILLQAPNYIPEQCVFELSVLVLLFLINLTMYTKLNRKLIMEANAPTDFGNKFNEIPAFKALVEYFNNCDELAKQAEEKTDAILENPKKSERKTQSQEEVQETVTKLLQKAGHHMEHTMLGSYVSILIGYLVLESEDNEMRIRPYLQNENFQEMIKVLQKYYDFMNLTASSEAGVVAHIKQTKKVIEDLKHLDMQHSTSDE